jgi:hypothetical protein
VGGELNKSFNLAKSIDGLANELLSVAAQNQHGRQIQMEYDDL